MDVTSLLNSSAAAANEGRRNSIDQTPTPSAVGGSSACSSVVATPSPEKTPPPRRASESRTPNRSRTPWDAGGYSLPLTLDTKMIQTSSAAKTALLCDSPTDHQLEVGGSPKSASPRHKFSDSRGSLSSYTTVSSSNNSGSHSRLSSLSTVSEYQPLASLITDFSSLETRAPEERTNSLTCPRMGDVQPPSPTPVRLRHDVSAMSSAHPSPRMADRARSPSDAMLMSRGQAVDPIDTSPSATREHTRSQFLLQPDSSPTRGHKRAVSAPDFPSLSTSTFNPRFPTFGPILEPTPPPSQHGDRRGSYTMDEATATPSSSTSPSPPLQASPAAPAAAGPTADVAAGGPTASPTNGPTPPTLGGGAAAVVQDGVVGAAGCLYTDKCDTGSQLRKAISHIFGRNKLCTRMIPAHIWVHLCRKHYQRSRYRNGPEYAKSQCDLVLTQIDRVQAWSDGNARQRKQGVLKDWTLSVRKREQQRMDKKTSAGKKRARADSDDDDEDDSDRAERSGTAVPAWLYGQLGEGYSTARIKTVVSQIQDDMEAGKLIIIPDIEILPNIITDGNDDAKKTYAKRRSVSGAATHRRSQSVGMALHPEPAGPMARRGSQPGYLLTTRLAHESPLEKRQRLDLDEADYPDQHSLPPFSRHHPNRFGSGLGRLQLAHRPAFEGIRENQAENAYHPLGPGAYGYGHGYGANPGPLPAPNPQRVGGQSLTQQLESSIPNGYSSSTRRPALHQRSQSELPSFHQNPSASYRPTSSSGLPPDGHVDGFSQGAPHPQQNGYGAPAHYGPPPSASRPWGASYDRFAASYAPVEGSTSYYEAAGAPRQFSFGGAAASTLSLPERRPLANTNSPTSRHSRHQSSPALTRYMPGLPPASLPARPSVYAAAPAADSFGAGRPQFASQQPVTTSAEQPMYPLMAQNDGRFLAAPFPTGRAYDGHYARASDQSYADGQPPRRASHGGEDYSSAARQDGSAAEHRAMAASAAPRPITRVTV